MSPRPLRTAALALAALALTGCTGQLSSEVPPPPWQTPSTTTAPTSDTWVVELGVDSTVAGKAVITYADDTTKTVEFSGPETHFAEDTDVPFGATVSIAVTLDKAVPADEDPSMCLIAGMNKMSGETESTILTSDGDQGGKFFTCTWTNDLGSEEK